MLKLNILILVSFEIFEYNSKKIFKYLKVLNLAFYSTERSLEDRISSFYNVFSTTNNGPGRQYGGELYLL